MSLAPTLAAVIANPDDDLARLAHADALSNTDAERAELIRAGVALAQEGTTLSERKTLRKTVESLTKRNGSRWLKEAGAKTAVTWSRGFISEIHYGYRQSKGALAPFEREPVTGVSMRWTQDPVGWGELVALGLLPRLQRLGIQRVPPKVLNGLLEETGLTQLRHLFLAGPLTDAQQKALSEAPWVTQLETLALTSSPNGEEALTALLKAHNKLSLRALYLSGSKVTDKGLARLVKHPVMQGLEILCLNRTSVGDAGVTAVAESASASTLKILEVADTGLSSDGAEALLLSETLVSINRLKVRGELSEDADTVSRLRARFPRAVIA